MNRISSQGRKDVRHFHHLSRQRKRLLKEPEDHNEDKEYGGGKMEDELPILLTETFIKRVNIFYTDCNTLPLINGLY